MVPSYFAFMRPILDALNARGGRATVSELTTAAAAALDLPAGASTDRVAWDGMPVAEARVRKATVDLERAGLVQRQDDAVEVTAAGREAVLPSHVGADALAERFPAYAAHRQEFLQRRGA